MKLFKKEGGRWGDLSTEYLDFQYLALTTKRVKLKAVSQTYNYLHKSVLSKRFTW